MQHVLPRFCEANFYEFKNKKNPLCWRQPSPSFSLPWASALPSCCLPGQQWICCPAASLELRPRPQQANQVLLPFLTDVLTCVFAGIKLRDHCESQWVWAFWQAGGWTARLKGCQFHAAPAATGGRWAHRRSSLSLTAKQQASGLGWIRGRRVDAKAGRTITHCGLVLQAQPADNLPGSPFSSSDPPRALEPTRRSAWTETM